MNARAAVLIFCGNGYGFSEIFKPIITRLAVRADVDLILSDYYLAEHTRTAVDALQKQGALRTWRVVHAFGENQSRWHHHRTLAVLARAFFQTRYALLITGSDFHPIDRYLINEARAHGTKTVALQTGVLTQTLQAYRAQQGFEQSCPSPAHMRRAQDLINKNSRCISTLLRAVVRAVIRRSALRLKIIQRSLLHHYVLPLLNARTFFLPSPYDRFGFIAGRTDAVIVYDPIERTALQTVVPTVKNVFLAHHPSSGLCQCAALGKGGLKTHHLLVLFGGPVFVEMIQEKFARWVFILARACALQNFEEVHLRFHPRTDPTLQWPHRMADAVRATGATVRVIDALKESLPDSICRYDGVIGLPSGSLRVARAVCPHAFVIGLPDCGEIDESTGSWILGAAEGIRMIPFSDMLTIDDFTPLPLPWASRPPVAHVLQRMLAV